MARAIFACVLVTVMNCSLLAQNTAPQVTIWLYRPNVDNISSEVTLYLDGRKLMNLGHGRFVGVPVSPGLHAFNWTNQPGARQIVVGVGADPQAYFEVTFNSGAPFLSINPLPVDRAMQAMIGLQPIDPNGVFDSGVIVPAQAVQAPVKALSADSTNNARPIPVSIPAEHNVAATAVVQIQAADTVSRREKTPKKEAEPNVPAKTGKETIWVTALNRESDSVTASQQQHKIPLFRSFMDKVKAENGQIYTISCSAHWIVSNCGPMVDGDSFRAEVEKNTMWITAHKEGNLWADVRVRYNILGIQ